MERRALLRFWRQVLRNCQLYPAESPVRAQAAEGLCGLLAETESKEDGISLAFFEDGIWVEGERTEEEEEAAESGLGRQLFRLGIRELRFLPGLSVEELLRLCDPLSRALQGLLNPVDEDLAVLLWEADLPHVIYFLYEAPSTDPASAEESPEQTPPERPLIEDYLDGEWHLDHDVVPDWEGPLDEQERAALLIGLRQEEAEETPLKAGRLLCELLLRETEEEGCRRIGRALEGHLETLLEQGRIALLLELRPHLSPRASAAGAAEVVRASLLARLQSAEFALRAALCSPRSKADEAASLQVLREAPTGVVPELLARCLEGEEGRRGAAARLVLDARLRADPDVRMACLRDSRPALRRRALEAATPPAEALPLLREMLSESDPKTRLCAVSAMGRMGVPASAASLRPALADPDPAVRLAATEALAALGGPPAILALLGVFSSGELARRSLAERRAVLRALARTAPGEAKPLLLRLAERRWLWWSRRRREEADLAVEALASLGDEEVGFLLGRWEGSRPDLLRRHARLLRLAPPPGAAGAPAGPAAEGDERRARDAADASLSAREERAA